MDLIDENLNKKGNTFFYNLNENKEFNEPNFYELMVKIKHLSDKISDLDRPKNVVSPKSDHLKIEFDKRGTSASV